MPKGKSAKSLRLKVLSVKSEIVANKLEYYNKVVQGKYAELPSN